MADTKIEWAEKVLNVFTGCTKVSEGCKNCYAERQAIWLQGIGQPKYVDGFEPRFHPKVLNTINPRQKGALYFVSSMSDPFHKAFTHFSIEQVITRLAICSQHRFMMLTKRASRMCRVMQRIEEMGYGFKQWPLPNLAMGVSVENQRWLLPRLKDLKECPAAYRFLSLEPLLGPIDLAGADPDWHEYIDLVIVGGESGPGARPMNPDWARNIRDDCIHLDVPFCFKQWGAWRVGESKDFGKFKEDKSTGQYMVRVGKKKAGRMLDGEIHDGKIKWEVEKSKS